MPLIAVTTRKTGIARSQKLADRTDSPTRQSRKDAVAISDRARVAVGFPDENRDDRKGDDEHQRGKRHVAGTPPVQHQ